MSAYPHGPPDSQEPLDILENPPGSRGPQVGADEWVARQAGRREYLPSWLGTTQRQFERIGFWPKLAIVGLAGAALPAIGLGGFQLQVGIDTLVIAAPKPRIGSIPTIPLGPPSTPGATLLVNSTKASPKNRVTMAR